MKGTLSDILVAQGKMKIVDLYDAIMEDPTCLDLVPKMQVQTPPESSLCVNATSGLPCPLVGETKAVKDRIVGKDGKINVYICAYFFIIDSHANL